MVQKVICTECDWHGTMMETDTIEDPRPLPGTNPTFWLICPDCRAAEHILTACEHEGCWRQASCGSIFPDKSYRQTCYDHSAFKRPKFAT